MNEFPLDVPGRECNIAIVASEFNHFIVQQLVDGALDALSRNGVSEQNVHLAWVPGAFELPLAADVLATSRWYSSCTTSATTARFSGGVL